MGAGFRGAAVCWLAACGASQVLGQVYQGTLESRVAIISVYNKCSGSSSSPNPTTVPLDAGATSFPIDASKLSPCTWASFSGATFTFTAVPTALVVNSDMVLQSPANFQSTATVKASGSITYAGANLRAGRRIGIASITAQDQSTTVLGSACYATQQVVDSQKLTDSGGSFSVTATASCVEDRLARVGVAGGGFKAIHDQIAEFNLSVGDDSDNYFAYYTVTISSTYTFGAATDAIRIQSITPVSGEKINNGDTQKFSASVAFTLASQASGTVQLEAMQPDGKVLASSPTSNVTRTAGTLNLTIPDFKLQTDSDTITVRAALRGSDGKILKQDSASYTVNTPKDSISLLTVFPAAGARLETGTAPPMFAAVSYDLQSQDDGEIFLELRTPKGPSFNFSNSIKVKKGKGIVGGDSMLKLTGGFLPDAASVELVAGLSSAGGVKRLATSDPVQYPVTASTRLTLRFGNYDKDTAQFTEDDPTMALYESGDFSLHYDHSFRVVSTGADLTPGNVVLVASERRPDEPAPILLNRVAPSIAADQSAIWIGGQNPDPFATAIILQARYESGSGQVVLSNPIEIPVEGVVLARPISPDDGNNSIYGSPPPAGTVQKGDTVNFKIPMVVTILSPDRVLTRCVSYFNNVDRRCEELPVKGPVSAIKFVDALTLQMPQTGTFVGLEYRITFTGYPNEGGYHPVAVKYQLVDPPATLVAGINNAIQLVNGAVKNIQTTKQRVVNSANEAKTLFWAVDTYQAILGKDPQKPPAGGGKRPAAASETGTILPVNSIWRFDPPIDRDGSFQGTIVLQYDPSQFPDDPNFDPAKLQVLAVDGATGQIVQLPSTVDPAAQTVSAALDSLAPVYGLGMVTKLSLPNAMFPAADGATAYDSGLAVVNLGKDAVSLQLNGYGATADPAALQTSVGAGAQFAGKPRDLFQEPDGSRTAWVQARAGTNTLAGIELFSDATRLEVLPLQRQPSDYLVVPWVEASTVVRSEIHLANPGNFVNQASLYLYAADGTLADSRWVELQPKAKVRGELSAIFNSMPDTFTGYVVISAANPVAAAALHTYRGALSASPSQAAATLLGAPATLYAPYLGADAHLVLVNTARQDAAITLRAFQDSGAALGSPVTITIGGGQQYAADLGAVFSLNPGASGWLRIDSSHSAVAGEIQFGDRFASAAYRAALPLVRDLNPSLVVPLVSQSGLLRTSLSIVSPNAAAVRVTAFDGSGGTVGSSIAAVSANGRISKPLPQWVAQAANLPGGYLRIDATQPVIAYAVLDPGTGKDYAAVAAVAAPEGAAPGNPPAPSLDLSPTSLDFGNVSAGATKDLTLTLRNTGTAPLTVTSVSSSNARFSLTSPALPFTVAAGASQTLAIRFAPAAAGAQSGTMTIASNDAAKPTAVVSLNGAGVAAAAPSIAVSPASLDFGNVASDGTKDLTLTVRNNGNATLAVSSVTSSNARFTASPIAPWNVPAGGSQTVTVRFAPTTAGVQNGTLTIASNDAAQPAVTVAVTGTGGNSPASTILKVDSGTFDAEVGFSAGAATAYFVNRLTPPSYPATLTAVQIYFSRRDDGLTLNTPLTIFSASNPGGSAGFQVSGTPDLTASSIGALDSFVTYPVPARTITSGDFIVGFGVVNPPNVFPAELDVKNPSQQRSYTSTGGAFVLIDSIGAPGNLAIRAVVTIRTP